MCAIGSAGVCRSRTGKASGTQRLLRFCSLKQTDMSTSETSSAATLSASTSSQVRRDKVLARVSAVCQTRLRPVVRNVDEQGEYPDVTMRHLGAVGLYAQHLTGHGENTSIDMPLAIESMALVGFECLSTAFCVWCHDACGWYLENTANTALRDAVLPSIASGMSLGGTGLSNPMKFYSGIETLRLKAERVDGGYLVNGTIPWVSNLGPDHYFGIVFEEFCDPEHRVMALVRCDRDGVELCDGGRFIALEGSRTYAVRMKNCFVDDGSVLADPADEYINAIRPGFVLMQVGMAVGHVRACITQMRKYDTTHDHVNQFLPDGADQLEAEIEELLSRTNTLAQSPQETDRLFVRDSLRARLDAGELSMKAAQACMLSGGARAYMENSVPFRKLREAYFVGVVTPATKHLRKEIARLTAIT